MIESLGNLIIVLFEVCIVILLFDGILYLLGQIFDFSWKKVLLWAAASFGFMWLRDYLKEHKRDVNSDVRDVNDNDFSENNNNIIENNT